MKKQWMVLPLALLLTVGLMFVGCDSSSSGGGSDLDDGSVWYHPLASGDVPYELKMGDNFEYGEGYQGQIMSSGLFEGARVLEGATYWLKATFTADRDLEDALWAGLVDTVTNYWNPLTWDGDAKDDDGTLIAPDGEDATYIIKDGDEITGLFKFVARKAAPSTALAENVLNFQTEGEGTNGTADSGKEGPFVITFTELVFAKDTAFDESKVPGFQPPAPPVSIDLSKIVTADSTNFATYSAGGVTGIVTTDTAFTELGKGDSGRIAFALSLPTDFDLADYDFVTIDGILLDANKDDLDVATEKKNWATVKFIADSTNIWSSTLLALNNFGVSDYAGGDNCYGAVLNTAVQTASAGWGLALGVTANGVTADVNYIVITEIKFHN